MGRLFTVKNEAFTCLVCQEQNPPAPQTCRNHCRHCLHSQHVDIHPGDRAHQCHGILEPIGLVFKGGEIAYLEFVCQKCGQTARNKIAPDDDRTALLAV